jgi:hypothetical protein
MLEFRSAIVNELEEVICWCSELTKEEIDKILTDHEEWMIKQKVCYW